MHVLIGDGKMGCLHNSMFVDCKVSRDPDLRDRNTEWYEGIEDAFCAQVGRRDAAVAVELACNCCCHHICRYCNAKISTPVKGSLGLRESFSV